MTYTVKTRGFERSALVMNGREIVAEVFSDREAADQHRNAALFASAPDLLQALRDVMAMLELEVADVSGARLVAHRAIFYAKAKYRQCRYEACEIAANIAINKSSGK